MIVAVIVEISRVFKRADITCSSLKDFNDLIIIEIPRGG